MRLNFRYTEEQLARWLKKLSSCDMAIVDRARTNLYGRRKAFRQCQATCLIQRTVCPLPICEFRDAHIKLYMYENHLPWFVTAYTVCLVCKPQEPTLFCTVALSWSNSFCRLQRSKGHQLVLFVECFFAFSKGTTCGPLLDWIVELRRWKLAVSAIWPIKTGF